MIWPGAGQTPWSICREGSRAVDSTTTRQAEPKELNLGGSRQGGQR